MTFLKFIIWKLKNTKSSYWMILGSRIFVRIFGVITFMDILNFFSKTKFQSQQDFYVALCSVFYFVFFVFLDNVIRVSSSFLLSEKIVKPLNNFKWLPFGLTLCLIYLSIAINDSSFTNIDLSTPSFLWSQISPLVIIPNLSFIIITTLIFYASAILNRNKLLKQENDLTI